MRIDEFEIAAFEALQKFFDNYRHNAIAEPEQWPLNMSKDDWFDQLLAKMEASACQ